MFQFCMTDDDDDEKTLCESLSLMRNLIKILRDETQMQIERAQN